MVFPYLTPIVIVVGIGLLLYTVYNQSQEQEENRYHFHRSPNSERSNPSRSSNFRRIEFILEGRTCSICLDSDPTNTTFTRCSHQFHIRCISEWRKHDQRCPNCRSPLI